MEFQLFYHVYRRRGGGGGDIISRSARTTHWDSLGVFTLSRHTMHGTLDEKISHLFKSAVFEHYFRYKDYHFLMT